VNDKPLILLLNDEPPVLELWELLLGKAGCQTVCTSNNDEALNLLRSHPIDLLIQDQILPDGSGVIFYKVLKADEQLKNIPILFLTYRSWEDFQTIHEEMKNFGDAYLGVPYTPPMLFAKIREMMIRHKKPLPQNDPKWLKPDITKAKI
jgi:DNA-binding response OmpR family regulator